MSFSPLPVLPTHARLAFPPAILLFLLCTVLESILYSFVVLYTVCTAPSSSSPSSSTDTEYSTTDNGVERLAVGKGAWVGGGRKREGGGEKTPLSRFCFFPFLLFPLEEEEETEKRDGRKEVEERHPAAYCSEANRRKIRPPPPPEKKDPRERKAGKASLY